MSSERREALHRLLTDGGVEWVLGNDPPGELDRLLSELEAVESYHERRYGAQVDILKSATADPDAYRAFTQSLAVPLTTPIRTMVLRLVSNVAIEQLSVEYELGQRVVLRMKLEGDQEPFESTDLWDLEVLRHVGYLKAGGRPVLHGYYAFVTPGTREDRGH